MRREALVVVQAVAVVALESQQQVDSSIARKADLTRLDSLVGTADNIVFLSRGNGISMRADVVEVVTGNQLTLQIFATIASASVFITHL